MGSKTIERREIEITQENISMIEEMITNPTEVNDFVKEYYSIFKAKESEKECR